MKVALYARVSKDNSVQDPENQLLRLREYAIQHDMKVVAEYVDTCSGGNSKKPERKKLLSGARGHRFSIVLCTKIDRISRSTKDFFDFLKQLDASNVKLDAIDQPELSTNTPTGELLLTILAGVAQFERSLIISRTLDGLARARAKGKRFGRPPNPAKTEEIIRLREQGLSLRQIAEKIGMSRQGVKQRLRRHRLQKRAEIET